jgi:hypothetical protein
MNLYLLIFFHPIPFVIYNYCFMRLVQATNEIFVANVACDEIVIVETNRKYLFSSNDY